MGYTDTPGDGTANAAGELPALGVAMVFVGPLVRGGTCLQRRIAFEDLGCRVVSVDTRPEWLARRIEQLGHRLAVRLSGPRDLAGVNEQLLALPPEPAPDLVWVEKGLVVRPSTLRALGERWPKATLVSFSPDDMFNSRNQSRSYLECVSLYDIHVTTKSFNVSELLAAGARDVHLMSKGFSPQVHRPLAVGPRDVDALGGDVGFIGWPERERSRSMSHLARRGIPVRVWGPWVRWQPHHPRIRIEGRPLWGDDYARAIAAFRINLCFLRKVNRDRQTTRSVEIPACGGFMLAERTDEHLRMFEEDREAVYFSSDEELYEKVRYYLAHEDERARIAAAGRRRCVADGYDYQRQLWRVLEHGLASRSAVPVRAPSASLDPVAVLSAARLVGFHRAIPEATRVDLGLLAQRHTLEITANTPLPMQPLRMLRLIRAHDAVVAWCAGWPSLWPLLLARWLGRPSLLVVGGSELACDGLPGVGVRNALRLATRIVVACERDRRRLVAAGVDEARIAQVDYGLDPGRYPGPTADREFRVVTVVEAAEGEARTPILEAFVRAAALCPDLEFIVLGRVNRRVLHKLRRLATPNVRFARGASQSEKIAWFGRSRAVVLRAGEGSVTFSLAEAMLSGCIPVLAGSGAPGAERDPREAVSVSLEPALLAGGVRAAMELWPERGPEARAAATDRFSLLERAHALEDAVLSLLRVAP